MKTIQDIIKSIKSSLSELGSPLSNTPNYSNAYIIFRAISQEIVKQYQVLDNYYLNSFISNSSSTNLDNRVNDFNITRQAGTPSSGFVFASSNTTIKIPRGTILNTTTSNYQFQTTQEAQLSSTGNYISITSLVNTELTNLDAGVILTSPYYPTINFIIANAVDLSGNYIGGLTGGKSSESDVDLRKRALSTLSNSSKGTITSIINVLQELGLAESFIKENFPIPGYFTVYLPTNDQTIFDRVESSIIEVKPLGVAFELKPITYFPIDIKVILTLSSVDYSQYATSQIKTIIYKYISNLSLGDILYVNNLAILSSNVTGVIDVRLVDPINNIIPPKDSLIRIRSVNFTINTVG